MWKSSGDGSRTVGICRSDRHLVGMASIGIGDHHIVAVVYRTRRSRGGEGGDIVDLLSAGHALAPRAMKKSRSSLLHDISVTNVSDGIAAAVFKIDVFVVGV